MKEMASFDTLEDDYKEIKKFIKTVENHGKLIIDIRGNRGGVNRYWKNIVGLLIDKPLSVEYYSFFKDGYRYNRDPYKASRVTTVKNLDQEILDRFPEEVKTDFDFYKKYFNPVKPMERHFKS